MLKRFTRLTFRASCLRLGNFRTLSSRVVEKSLNWSADCAALHYGPLETAPIEGFGSPRAATALLLTVEFVLVSTVVVFPWVRNLSEPPPHLLCPGAYPCLTSSLHLCSQTSPQTLVCHSPPPPFFTFIATSLYCVQTSGFS